MIWKRLCWVEYDLNDRIGRGELADPKEMRLYSDMKITNIETLRKLCNWTRSEEQTFMLRVHKNRKPTRDPWHTFTTTVNPSRSLWVFPTWSTITSTGKLRYHQKLLDDYARQWRTGYLQSLRENSYAKSTSWNSSWGYCNRSKWQDKTKLLETCRGRRIITRRRRSGQCSRD